MKDIMKTFRITPEDKEMFDFIAENMNIYDWLHNNLKLTVNELQNPGEKVIVQAVKAKMFENGIWLYPIINSDGRYPSNREAIVRLGDKLTMDTDEKGKRFMKIDISDLRSEV